MSKKDGWSEEKTNWSGETYTQYYDGEGNKIRWSRAETDVLGREYTQHYKGDGYEKEGWSRAETDVLGREYTQHYKGDGYEKEGWSQKEADILGSEYTQHYGRHYGGSHQQNRREKEKSVTIGKSSSIDYDYYGPGSSMSSSLPVGGIIGSVIAFLIIVFIVFSIISSLSSRKARQVKYSPNTQPMLGSDYSGAGYITPTPTPEPRKPNFLLQSLNFFEGGYNGVPRGQRLYASRFPKSQSRYIYWELNLLSETRPSSDYTFTINAKWFKQNGNTFGEQTRYAYMKLDGSNSDNVAGYGYNDAGQWAIGFYRVIFYIDETTTVSKTFEIYSDQVEYATPTPTPTPNVLPVEADQLMQPRTPIYQGPVSGVIILSVKVDKETGIVFENGTVSTGSLYEGSLPGVPVSIKIEPSSKFTIVEAPEVSNEWKRLILRSNKKQHSVVYIYWDIL